MNALQYTHEEVQQRGQGWYEQTIRPQIETTAMGQFLVVEVESGDFEVDRSELRALARARRKHPTGAFYLLRVGAPAAYRLGGTARRSPQ